LKSTVSADESGTAAIWQSRSADGLRVLNLRAMAKPSRAQPKARPAQRELRPAVVIHSLSHAEAALAAAAEAGAALELWSAEGAAASAGAGWFKAVIEAARRARPEASFLAVLDCADMPGFALGALRIGIEAVAFAGPARVVAKLADIAEKEGCRLLRRRPRRLLDLGESLDPLAACRSWLAGQALKKPGRSAIARRARKGRGATARRERG